MRKGNRFLRHWLPRMRSITKTERVAMQPVQVPSISLNSGESRLIILGILATVGWFQTRRHQYMQAMILRGRFTKTTAGTFMLGLTEKMLRLQ